MTNFEDNKDEQFTGDPPVGDLSELETAVLLAPLSNVPTVRWRKGAPTPKRTRKRGFLALGATACVAVVVASVALFAHNTVKPTPAVAAVIDRASKTMADQKGTIVHQQWEWIETVNGKTQENLLEFWSGNGKTRARVEGDGDTIEWDNDALFDGKQIIKIGTPKNDKVPDDDDELELLTAEEDQFFDLHQMLLDSIKKPITAEMKRLKTSGEKVQETEISGQKAYRISTTKGKATAEFYVNIDSGAPIQITMKKGAATLIMKFKVEHLPMNKENKAALTITGAHPKAPVVKNDAASLWDLLSKGAQPSEGDALASEFFD